MTNKFERDRQAMVEHQIRSRGIEDPKVLEAMLNVPRDRFVSPYDLGSSYHDGPLSIGHGQTISQPYIVAYMTDQLELTGSEKVLELGTGSGYQTAVLAEIAAEVYTIEVVEALGRGARDLLTGTFDYTNIKFKFGNGRQGWPEYAPFDRIMLTAAPVTFPQPLFDQLAEGGLAIAPVGDYYQQLVKYRKIDGEVFTENLLAVAFVPFV
jgi:protein-L-isoaspartate(D-aspartate) O-methyltransferase